MVRGGGKARDKGLGGRERGVEGQDVGQALGRLVCVRGGEALEVFAGKVLCKGFQAGDPDYSAVLWGRAGEERGQEVREEVVTEDVGAEDFPERRVRRGCCLGVTIGYWIDGMAAAVVELLGRCFDANATDFEGWVCDSLHRACYQTPYGSQPVDACEAASSGVENDRVEFWHIVRREQSLGEGLH